MTVKVKKNFFLNWKPVPGTQTVAGVKIKTVVLEYYSPLQSPPPPTLQLVQGTCHTSPRPPQKKFLQAEKVPPEPPTLISVSECFIPYM